MKLYRILMLTLFAYALSSCGGAEERKAVYMEKAKSSIEAGDYSKARIELKNVLQIDPKDGEAYYQLGRVYEQLKDYRKAFANYNKAEEINPNLLVNQAKLGRFYLLLVNDVEKAQDKINFILSKEPNNADGLLLKAAVNLKNNKIDEAIVITKNIVASNPEHAESIIFLATLYIKEDKLTDAISVLDTALNNKPNSEQLNKLLAVALVKNKEYERAEAVYKIFLDNNPTSSASYNNLAAFYIQIDNKIKAEEVLRASVESNAEDVERILTLVKYIKTSKGNDIAIQELNIFIENHNDIGLLRTALAELYILSGDKKIAAEIYKQAINDFSEEETGVTSRVALASIYISDKKYAKASETMEEAILISPNAPEVNFLRAKLALQDKDLERAIIALRIVIKEMPESVDAYILLTKVYQQEKSLEQANSTLNSAYENNKTNADGLLKLAKYYLSSDLAKAEKIIDDYNNLNESNYEGLSIKAAILNQNKQQAEAYDIAKTLMELYPGKSNGYVMAIPYIQRNDREEAISILEKGYLSAKDNRKLLIYLTTLQVEDKKFDVVEKRIKAEISAAPNDAQLKILLAKVYMNSNDIDLAESLLKETIETNSILEEPYLLLSQVYQVKRDLNSVKSVLVKGKANAISSIKIPLRLASVYETQGSYSEAISVYTELHESNPENLIVMNNLASLLSDYGDGKGDLELAKSLAKKLEENAQPVFLDTVGWVYYKLGDYQKAINNLLQVVEAMPDVNVFNYHLGMAYQMSGDKVKAKTYLEKSLADNKEFKEKGLAEAALKNL